MWFGFNFTYTNECLQLFCDYGWFPFKSKMFSSNRYFCCNAIVLCGGAIPVTSGGFQWTWILTRNHYNFDVMQHIVNQISLQHCRIWIDFRWEFGPMGGHRSSAEFTSLDLPPKTVGLQNLSIRWESCVDFNKQHRNAYKPSRNIKMQWKTNN
jgi:hypothetical protein